MRLLKFIGIIEKDELPLGKKNGHSLLYPRVINFFRLNHLTRAVFVLVEEEPLGIFL